MKIKTNKGIKNVDEIFPTLETFKNHVLKLDKNIRYDNNLIKDEIYSLMVKLELEEGVICLSLLRNWLKKNYSFKTKKWSQLNYWTERGWSDKNALIEIEKRNKEIKQRNRLCKEYWVNKGYTEDEAAKEISRQQKKSSKCVKTYHGKSKKILKDKGYTEDEIKRICLTPTNIDFWINKGYSEIQAKEIISKNQSNSAKKVDFKKRLLPSNIEYWLKRGYSELDAKLNVTKHQTTFSFLKCLEKYGNNDGEKKFTERQNKWLTCLTKNGNMCVGYSKISQELFYELLKTYNTEDRNNIFFATHNGEFKIEKENGGLWIYDFTDVTNKKIIEYNGDSYHANPNKYSPQDYPHPFRKNITAQDIWNKDKQKIDIAVKNGFEIIQIWDSEYRWGDKEKIIDKCLRFLNKK